ncbi:MAG TPA: D-amino-acid transaminase [Virgibacillus sp.]|nr:D-amino-acid transaminase [Virgibacillus sp.]
MNYILFNHDIVMRDQFVDIEDRGYQFGDGIYEVIGVYNRMPMLVDEHLQRLERSAKEIALKLPYSTESLKEKLLELIEKNDLVEGILYFQVSRGSAPRWHEFPEADTPAVTVAYTRSEERMTGMEDDGGKAITTEDNRWLRCDIKSLNLLPNVLAKQKAHEQDAIEAIFHRDGAITEASASNVFIVKAGELYTHPANHLILNGITRQQILKISEKLNMTVHEKPYDQKDLIFADEVFITATKLDVIPIIQIDDSQIGTGLPGQVTKKIVDHFRALITDLKKEAHPFK